MLSISAAHDTPFLGNARLNAGLRRDRKSAVQRIELITRLPMSGRWFWYSFRGLILLRIDMPPHRASSSIREAPSPDMLTARWQLSMRLGQRSFSRRRKHGEAFLLSLVCSAWHYHARTSLIIASSLPLHEFTGFSRHRFHNTTLHEQLHDDIPSPMVVVKFSRHLIFWYFFLVDLRHADEVILYRRIVASATWCAFLHFPNTPPI